jgi:hypothetical protein
MRIAARALRLRACGTLAALAIVVPLALPALLDGPGDLLQRAIAGASVLIAGPIGWVFAPRVISGDRRRVVKVAAITSIVAVPSGAVLVAMIVVSQGQHASVAAAIPLVGSWALLGLAFAGPSMFGLSFACALLWGALMHYVIWPALSQNAAFRSGGRADGPADAGHG